MSMHIEGAYLTTTRTQPRDVKITKAKQLELEAGWRDRNKRLREMGLAKESFQQYMDWVFGRGAKTKPATKQKGPVVEVVSRYVKSKPATASIDDPRHWSKGTTSSKPSPVYTGTKMLGIGVMHKSNSVPVFSDDEAKQLATMRR